MRSLKKINKKEEPKQTSLVTLGDGLTIKDLSVPEVIQDLFPKIKNYFGKKTVTVRRLQIAIGQEFALAGDIANNVRSAIIHMNESDAIRAWKDCGRNLKSELLISHGETLDLELYDKLELMPKEIAICFFDHKAFANPISSPYSRRYGRFDYETLEEFIAMLEELDTRTRFEVLSSISIPLLYLASLPELDYLEETDEDAYREVFLAFKCGETVPQQAPFLFFIQESAPAVFKRLGDEFLNRDWEELRNMFYELHNRNKIDKEKAKAVFVSNIFANINSPEDLVNIDELIKQTEKDLSGFTGGEVLYEIVDEDEEGFDINEELED